MTGLSAILICRRDAYARHLGIAVLCCTAILLSMCDSSFASILKTKRKRVRGPNEYQELPLVIGSGVEFTSDSEGSEYDFPFLVEYGFSEELKLSVEADYLIVQPMEGNPIHGRGDLETSLIFEFLSERRSRPALAAEALVKWPTAMNRDLGTGMRDYSLGIVVSKEFVHFDADFNASYTIVGDPPDVDFKNSAEFSLSSEWRVSRRIDLEGELVTDTGSVGSFHGQPGSIGGGGGVPAALDTGGAESAATLGVAEHLTAHLKLEEGGTILLDGSWVLVTSWEWDFGEGR